MRWRRVSCAAFSSSTSFLVASFLSFFEWRCLERRLLGRMLGCHSLGRCEKSSSGSSGSSTWWFFLMWRRHHSGPSLCFLNRLWQWGVRVASSPGRVQISSPCFLLRLGLGWGLLLVPVGHFLRGRVLLARRQRRLQFRWWCGAFYRDTDLDFFLSTEIVAMGDGDDTSNHLVAD